MSNLEKIKRLVDELSIRDEEIKQMKETLELIIENASEGYWDWHISDDFEYLSPRFKAQLGYEKDEMENHPSAWMGLVNEDDLVKLQSELNKHIESRGEYPFDCKCRFTHKEGHEILIWCKGKIVEWDEEWTPIRMVGTHIDITNLND
jgi:PAS domain S-box-containing protein